MKKTAAVRGMRGEITSVYFLDDKDIRSEETVFNREDWLRGVSKWNFDVDCKKKLGEEWINIGNEVQDIGHGFFYRIHFVKKNKFTQRSANSIVEEYMEKWEEEQNGKTTS